ncbi:MAG: hypothetical protein CV087_09925, partial [Candidatus Brocadia sp. WS118]
YNAALQPLSETISGLYSATITRNYAISGVIGRPTGLTTGALYTQTYGYDTKGRFDEVGWSVVAGAYTGTANYGFVANSDLIGTLTTTAGQSTTYSYEPNRNLRTQINNQFSSTLISRYDYSYDELARREWVKNSGTAFAAAAFNLFDYNDRSELQESARYLGTNETILTIPVTGELRDYTYDPIGNRTAITVGTNGGTYTPNNLNQYASATVPGGGSNSFTHDDDGNLTAISGNKNVQYVFDAENRMITAQPTTPALNDKKLDLVYDYQGRRVQKIVSNWSGVAWVPLTTKRFVYDGWNMIEEQTVAGTSKYQIWGLDLSQSMEGAGGIGGLLTQVDVGAVKSYAYLYDGNGNVGQLIDNLDGSIDAHYEYDPYGNSILASGTAASANPYRFSTKYLDNEYNFYYFDYRYYDPDTGRWINRDPLSEFGSLNLRNEELKVPEDLKLLYAFNMNNAINSIDPNGLDTLLILVGEEFSKSSSIFKVSAETAAKAYRESAHYSADCDAVVTIDLTGTKDSAYKKVQKAFSEVEQIRFIIYVGHGDSEHLFLTRTRGAGANISANGNDIKKNGGQYNSLPVTGLSTANVTEHASASLFSCNARSGIATAFSEHFGIPVESAAAAVNFNEDGSPFIRRPRLPSVFGFCYTGGTPSDREEVPRDGSWSEKAAREKGY